LAVRQREELVGESSDHIAHPKSSAPVLGNARFAVEGAGDLAEDGPCGVGIVTEVDGEERASSNEKERPNA
jgi:hypothetical protein